MTFTADKPKCVETNSGVSWATAIKKNGVVVAKISNSGRGGCDNHYWLDKSLCAEFADEAEKYNAAHPHAALAFFQKIDLLNQPDADYCSRYVESLMQEAERRTAFEKDCKKHVVIKLADDTEDQPYRIFKNARPTADFVAKIRSQYPGIKILNPGIDQ